MTHDPPKRGPKPTPDHVALVVRGHVQRGFWLKMKTEVLERKVSKHFHTPRGVPRKDLNLLAWTGIPHVKRTKMEIATFADNGYIYG